MIDGVEAFHAAYARGRVVVPPAEYLDMIVIPAVLHIDPERLLHYPPALRAFLRARVMDWIAGGQCDLRVIAAQGAE